MPLSLLNHSALALFAQRTRIPTSARSIGFCAIWVCISSSSSVHFYQACMSMSRSIYNSTYRLGLYTFTPSYTLCALTSHHRVRCSSGLKQLAKYHSQVTYTPCKSPQKAVEGATALFTYRSLRTYILLYRYALPLSSYQYQSSEHRGVRTVL